MSVDIVTGEIVGPAAELAVIDHTAVSVVTTLENAKRWLATAVEMSGPAEIAQAKAYIVTAETYARELRLSKDIQLDAQEMVRRAEFALGKAIRKGQEDGSIASKAEMASYAGRVSAGQRLGQSQSLERPTKPSDFATESELMGARGDGLYALADNADADQFETALSEARSEGNLSRANVVRKVKKPTPAKAVTRDMRAQVIADLAEQGYSSRQMPVKVGVTEETIRQIARDYDIEIPADKIVGRTRRIDHTHIVSSTVIGLENTVSALAFLDFNEVDPSEAGEWATSLSKSLSELRRFHNKIKEMTRA